MVQPWNLGPPAMDFSPIGRLSQSFFSGYDDGRKQTLDDDKRKLLASAASGGDLNVTGMKLIGMGDVTSGAALLGIGQKQADRELERKWLQGDSAAPTISPANTSSAGPASLIQNESGGNWSAQNNATGAGGLKGHFGRLQFGQARLQEAAAAGAIPAGTTPQAFMASPEMQQKAEAWHFNNIDQAIKQNGYDQLVGKTLNGVPITIDGMRAVAHLGGNEGLRKFITSGGAYNPADENGTRLSDYFARHRGQQQSQIAQAPGAQPVQGDDPAKLEADASYYDKTNPEAARQLRARAAAARGQPEADRPATGATAAQGFSVPQAAPEGIMNDPEVKKWVARLNAAPTERTREIAKQSLDIAIKDAQARSEGTAEKREGQRLDNEQKRRDLASKKLTTFSTPDGKTYSFDAATGQAEIVADGRKKTLQAVKSEDGTYYAFDPDTGDFRKGVESGPKSEDITSLRKEVQGLPSYKNFAQAAPIYKSMLDAAGRDTKAADLNLVYGLGKIMDPGSVVREGEIQMANDTQGVAAKLNGMINSLNGGARLGAQAREALMKEAFGRLTAYRDQFGTDATQFQGIAGRRGMDIRDILPDFGDFKPFAKPEKPAKGATTPDAKSSTASTPVRPGSLTVPPQAVQALRDNPDRAAEFDAKFGAGMSQRILGKP